MRTHDVTPNGRRGPRSTPGRDGFTLIEIMVATTILIMIVMMVAMVFQQSSIAWQSGVRRSEGNMTLRSLIGILQREMSRAVDATAFVKYEESDDDESDDDESDDDEFRSTKNIFLENYAEFVIQHRPEYVILEPDEDPVLVRSARKIVYKYDDSLGLLYREESVILPGKIEWKKIEIDGNGETMQILNRTMPLSYFRFTPVYEGPNDTSGLPMVVEIDAAVSQEGTFSTIQAWSAGPNGIDEDGGGDDIRSW